MLAPRKGRGSPKAVIPLALLRGGSFWPWRNHGRERVEHFRQAIYLSVEVTRWHDFRVLLPQPGFGRSDWNGSSKTFHLPTTEFAAIFQPVPSPVG